MQPSLETRYHDALRKCDMALEHTRRLTHDLQALRTEYTLDRAMVFLTGMLVGVSVVGLGWWWMG